VIHLATHGFFLPGSCPSDHNTDGLRDDGETDAFQTTLFNQPLLYSGVLLAGANRRSDAAFPDDDGVLTAREIAALDFGGTSCAVLSACETGLGQIRSGEGVFGLRTAFRIAGVRSVVMSLWPVEDVHALEWMRAFYANRYREKKGLGEAIRDSNLEMLRRLRKAGDETTPGRWAGFVGVGDWH
jgi:CHAT domain-containing protein